MRYWLYKALCAVFIDGIYSNLYLRNHLQELPEKDRALATRIFYGTIQNHLYCEYMWKPYTKKKVNPKLEVLLNMSVYQMLFLDKVPTYAIVDDAVNISKKINKKSSGFVNAILHKVKEIDLPENKWEALSIQTSCPLWVIQMWKAQYGEEIAESMALDSNAILPIHIRLNEMMDSSLILENPLIEEKNGIYVYTGKEITNDPMYKEGKISVQDHGSYKIVEFLDPQRGDSILDCCAAPGTKTMAIAERMHNEGHIDSCDLYEHRVQLINNDKKRLHLSCVHTHCQDATDLSNYGFYDKILCDVPCSGYGVLARKPDIKLRMKSSDMDTLIPLQMAILESCSQHIKDNGIIVYSTCTINKKENEKQIEKFLKNHDEIVCLEQQTIFPNEVHDGFFMAKLKKTRYK